jgi:Flp pilus assembly pilin Flp
MNLLNRLWHEEDGQGMVEYSFIVLLVAVSFWLGVRNTDIGTSLTSSMVKVADCVLAPFSCAA